MVSILTQAFEERDGDAVEVEPRLVVLVTNLLDRDVLETDGVEAGKDVTMKRDQKHPMIVLERDLEEVEFERREVGDPVERRVEGGREASHGGEFDVEVASLRER